MLAAGSASPQELPPEEVLRRVAEALGGREAWAEVETLEVSGEHSSFSRTRPFLVLRQRPDLYRLEYSEGSRDLVVGYDGETAWWKTEITMVSKASWSIEAPSPHARAIRADAPLAPVFVAPAESGHAIEVLGKAELEGVPYYKAVVTVSGGGVEEWYLDADTFLPMARISTGAYHGTKSEQRSFYSDYRKVGRIVIPHHVEVEIGNDFLEFAVEQARINVEIDRDLFSLPLPAGMAWLEGLAGEWKVKAECRGTPGGPWLESEGTSVIEKRQRGALLAETLSYSCGGFRWNVDKLYAYDRFREVFRVIRFDNFASQADLLAGVLAEGRLAVSNVASGTTWTVYENTYHSREVIHDLTEDSFSVDLEVSLDGGESWTVDKRLLYLRQASDDTASR
jgi:hypothetical protein